MKIAYVSWLDATTEEANHTPSDPVKPSLCLLHEVGFLLAETEDVVVLGMELAEDKDVKPSRWRLHIPKVCIQEMKVVELASFKKVRKTKNGSK